MNRRTFQSLALGAAASRLATADVTNARSRIKAGQIGTRHAHAAGQFAALRQCADFEIVGVAEPDEEQRKRSEKSGEFANVNWMSVEQLLNTPALQMVA